MATLTVRGNQNNQPAIVGGPNEGQPKNNRTATKVRYNLPAMLLPLLLAGLVSCAGVTSPASKSGGGPQSSPTTLAASSSSLTFGQEPLGKASTAQTLTITNTGSAQANIQSISCNNSSFTYNGPALPAALPPSQSVKVSVAFDPKSPGSISGVLSIASDATDSTLGVNVSGQGAAPVVSVSPASIPFGNEVVNSKSSSHTVTVSNTGLLAMNVTQVSVSASQFIASGPAAPFTIQPGSSVNYAVAFDPTAAQGYSGALSIASNAFNGPASASLSGTGISGSTATVSVSPGALSFSSMPVGSASNPQMLTIKNTGSAQATIQTISSNNTSFSYSGISLPAAIGPSSSVQLAVSFDPKAPGAASGNLSISGSANNLPANVGLTGTGEAAVISVGPSSVNFGNETQNVTSGSQSISVSNTGNASLSINSVGISPAQFAYSGPNPPFTILPGNNVTYNVTFTPATTQAYSGSMSFTSNAFSGIGSVSMSGTGVSATSVLDISPSSIPFGNQLVNTTSPAQNVSVQNGGNTSLTISQVSVPSGPFAVTGFSGNTTLAMGQSMPLSVTYTPNTETGDSATLSVAGTSSDGSPVSASVNLSGIGIAQNNSPLACGVVSDGLPHLPIDWKTFTAPAKGQSYTDIISGCKVTRLTDSPADGVPDIHHYSTQSPMNSNDTMIMLGDINGNTEIVDPSGNVVVSKATFASKIQRNDSGFVWDAKNPNVFYYANNNSLMMGTVSGNSVTFSTYYTFPEYAADVVNIMDSPDLSQDGDHLPMIGQNVRGGPEDVFIFQLSTKTKSPVYTTTCTGNVNGSNNACLHKLITTPRNGVIIQFAASGTGAEQGQHLWEAPWTRPLPLVNDGGSHLDTGLDMNGNEVAIQEGSSSGQADACPTHGGSDMNTLPSMALSCLVDKNYLAIHVSYRGNASQPWVIISGQGQGNGPEWFDNDSKYSAPYIGSASDGSSWKSYQNEIIAIRIDAANSLLKVIRLGHSYSRANESYESQPQASISRDGKYVIFNSNMAYAHTGCPANDDAPHCSDVYLMKIQ